MNVCNILELDSNPNDPAKRPVLNILLFYFIEIILLNSQIEFDLWRICPVVLLFPIIFYFVLKDCTLKLILCLSWIQHLWHIEVLRCTCLPFTLYYKDLQKRQKSISTVKFSKLINLVLWLHFYSHLFTYLIK